jgi:hypothetical protein
VEGLVPAGGTVGQQPSPPPAPGPTKTWAIIRAKGNDAYDKAGHPGVPVDPTAAGAGSAGISRYIPYGSLVLLTGPAVQGKANSTGNSTWYPVEGGGFVNGFDITGTTNTPPTTPGGGSGGPMTKTDTWPRWPGGTVQTRVL